MRVASRYKMTCSTTAWCTLSQDDEPGRRESVRRLIPAATMTLRPRDGEAAVAANQDEDLVLEQAIDYALNGKYQPGLAATLVVDRGEVYLKTEETS